MKQEFIVTAEDVNMRLDQFLVKMLPDHSRSFLQKLVKDSRVTVDGSAVTANKLALAENQAVAIELPELKTTELTAEEFDFQLLYEDEYMAVINKPAGVVVHPAPGNPDGTVVNAIISRYPELRSAELPDGSRPGIVHRLDKDTSGCLAIARTPESQSKLCELFAERETRKTYLALVIGTLPAERGRIENLIGRHPVNRQKMAIVTRNGKEAVSEYEVVKSGFIRSIKVSLVRVRIFTGRTHQIRVHLSSLGNPVLGDELYGGARRLPGIPRQMLHAWRLSMPHPLVEDKTVKCEAPLPEDFQALLQEML